MKFLLKLFLIAVLGIIIYEAFAVIRANSKTTEIFANALKDENIQITLEDISKEKINSLLSVQDPSFYKHNGFDFKTPGAGKTTITQAITKYLYFEKFSKGFKKIEQTLIAWLVITPAISKDDQLIVFLNSAYLGHIDGKEVRGFSEASRLYYNKSFNELSETEYLSIVAMLIAPKVFNIKTNSKVNLERVNLIKQLLNGKYVPTKNSDVYYGQNL